MLVYLRSGGQLCNRLWALLPSLSLAMERKEKLSMLSDGRHELIEFSEFPYLMDSGTIRFLPKTENRRVASVLSRMLRRWDVKGDLDVAGKSRCGLYVIDSWNHIYDRAFISKYQAQLLHLFSFRQDVVKRVCGVLQGYSGITIGVHIRRGDYKEWREGRYYYDDDVYVDVMKKMEQQVRARNQTCRFLICSNEDFDLSVDGLHLLRIPHASGIDDLFALSQCNYIIGPPSSYSQWASFYGEVPFYCLLNPQDEVPLDSFSPIIGMNSFRNGKHLYNVDGVNFKIE